MKRRGGEEDLLFSSAARSNVWHPFLSDCATKERGEERPVQKNACAILYGSLTFRYRAVYACVCVLVACVCGWTTHVPPPTLATFLLCCFEGCFERYRLCTRFFLALALSFSFARQRDECFRCSHGHVRSGRVSSAFALLSAFIPFNTNIFCKPETAFFCTEIGNVVAFMLTSVL